MGSVLFAVDSSSHWVGRDIERGIENNMKN